jgi:hypothetical protein
MRKRVQAKSSNHGPASGCTMLRSARALRLPRSFIPRHGCCYSTAPVPAETLLTPEIEKGDQAREIELRTKQAPNRSKTWAPSQRPRSDAFNHPRFEGAILEMQVRLGLYCHLMVKPRPVAAIDLIAEQPIRYVGERIAVCDGGMLKLQHF